MTFKVTVIYQLKSGGDAMARELSGVEKIERAWEKIGGESAEALPVYDRAHTWSTWGIEGVLAVTMIPEFKTE
jgi:hypothetical protein